MLDQLAAIFHLHPLAMEDVVNVHQRSKVDAFGDRTFMVTHMFRMNEIMKALTIISTLFIPLTFIVGIYGMNFDPSSLYNLPELKWRYGYAICLAVMAVIAIGQILFFRRKGWIGTPKSPASSTDMR